jgi:GxxExxY protein
VDTDTNGTHGSLVYGEVTNSIISAAYRVHSRLGPGLLERVYKVCLAHELTRNEVPFVSEKLLPVEYDGLVIELGYRVDFLVADVVIVEIKAVETILPVHESQLLAYLRLSHKRVGLLVNFNVAKLREGIRRKVSGF